MGKTLNTLRKMNRPIKFFGLSSLQFLLLTVVGMVVIIVMIFQRLPTLVIVGVVVAVIVGFTAAVGKLNQEYKKGNPDYITSQSIKGATPKKIIDKHKFFNLIKI
ncbi:MAG: hypothetical protein J6Y01_02745 [Spirochaetales bacterium]|nr:hypothetical protein [Spirochaetales bacterium]